MKCKKCNTEIGDSRFCGNCGAAQGDEGTVQEVTSAPKKKKGFRMGCLGFLIFCAIVCAFVSPSENSVPNQTPTNNVAKEPSKAKLEVLEHSVTNDGYFRYITGKIKNNTNKTYGYVQISINLYKDDTLLESTLDNINNLAPGQTWEFKAPVFNEECNQYRIEEVSGF